MEQQKMSGKERNAMVYLVALDDELTKATPILKSRLRSASQNAWRDWRLAQTLVQRLACLLVDTMPDSIPSLPDELYTCEYAQVDWNAKED